MALCRGPNAGYGSVGLLEPRIHQVGENGPPVYRQRSLVLDTHGMIEASSKTALRGRAKRTRRQSIRSFPHGSFIRASLRTRADEPAHATLPFSLLQSPETIVYKRVLTVREYPFRADRT